ncbi:MAG: XRE family transcriptional regulator [Acidobacteria bacterium]|nr:XRE family transcriptional regulator [Acidobacteriota bacterium]
MTFLQLQQRLLEHLRLRVQSGEATERGLARLAGVSQPHLHNVLKGKRLLSVEMADEILRNLQIGVLDLIQPADIERWRERKSR